MSTSKLDTSGIFQPITLAGEETKLTLSSHAVRIRKTGIEFSSLKPLPVWKEMSLDLFSRADASKLHCNGVVVACDGNRHMGYTISMVFMNLSPQAEAHLELLARAQ